MAYRQGLLCGGQLARASVMSRPKPPVPIAWPSDRCTLGPTSPCVNDEGRVWPEGRDAHDQPATSTGTPTRSILAGTCLCQGVPAIGSRSALSVSSFSATPRRTREPSARW